MSTRINVVSSFGGRSSLGMMDAKVGMPTDKGTIQLIASTGVVIVGSGAPTEGKFHFYSDRLFIDVSVATGSYSWPTGDGSVVDGHSGTHEAGVLNNNVGAYLDGTGVVKTYTK